jgi:glycosyltransferase involved in cell wall biosynthesis
LPMIYCGPSGEGGDIVIQHDAGLFVPPADPRALAGAIRELQRNPERLARMAANAGTAAASYSRTRQAELSLEVFHRALEAAS